MIITSDYKLAAGKSLPIELPNLAQTKFLVPTEISVYTKKDTLISPAKNVSVSVSCGSNKLVVLHEAYFQTTHEINLSDYRCRLNEGNDVLLNLINTSSSEFATFRIEVEYTPTYGNIIYQNSYLEVFNRTMKDIYSAGICSRIVFHFNHPVKKAELMSIFSRDKEDEEWFDSLEMGDTDENNQYVLDFTDDELKFYPRYLNMMELTVPKREKASTDDDDDDDDLRLHVLAYGFPRTN